VEICSSKNVQFDRQPVAVVVKFRELGTECKK